MTLQPCDLPAVYVGSLVAAVAVLLSVGSLVAAVAMLLSAALQVVQRPHAEHDAGIDNTLHRVGDGH